MLTEKAVDAIRRLVTETGENGETGLRIRAEPIGEDEYRLDVEVVASPAENDFLLEEEDVRIYLEQAAFLHLNDKLLDAQTNDRQVVFSISEQ